MKLANLVSFGSYRSLRASRSIPAGTRVFALRGTIVAEASTYTVQIGIGRHILPPHAGTPTRQASWQFMNHSCSPNVTVDTQRRAFLARRDIAAGEELTFNYNTTEWEMASPFECLCGESGCIGRIAGFNALPPAQQRQLLPDATPHIQMLSSLATAAKRGETATPLLLDRL